MIDIDIMMTVLCFFKELERPKIIKVIENIFNVLNTQSISLCLDRIIADQGVAHFFFEKKTISIFEFSAFEKLVEHCPKHLKHFVLFYQKDVFEPFCVFHSPLKNMFGLLYCSKLLNLLFEKHVFNSLNFLNFFNLCNFCNFINF